MVERFRIVIEGSCSSDERFEQYFNELSYVNDNGLVITVFESDEVID